MAACQLTVVPVVIGTYGHSGYGTLATILSTSSVLVVADQGLAAGVRTYVAEAAASGSLETAKTAIRLGARQTAKLTLAVWGIVAIGELTGAWTPVLGQQSHLISVYISICASLIYCSVIFRALEGLGKTAWVALFPILNAVWLLGAAISCKILDAPFVAIVALAGAANLLAAICGGRLLKSQLTEHFDLRSQQRVTAASVTSKEIWATTWPMMIISIGITASFSIDPIVITSTLGARVTADYAVVEKLYAISFAVMTSVFPLLWTHFATSRSEGRVSVSAVLRAAYSLAAGATILGVGLVLGGPYFLQVWLGNEVKDARLLLIAFGALLVSFALQLAPAAAMSDAHGLRRLALITSLSAGVNVPISIVLAESIGVTGPVWSSAACLLLIQVVPIWVMIIKRFPHHDQRAIQSHKAGN